MRGHCKWPARVTSIENDVISVEFFGDQTTTKTTVKHIFHFADSFVSIINSLKEMKSNKKLLFKKAVEEAEIVLGIPEENSVLKYSSSVAI